MKISKINTIIILFLFILASSSYGIELNLKISGSFCYMNLDYINRCLNSREQLVKKRADFYEGWSYKEGEVKNFHFGNSFEGELLISISSHFAASLGTGYIYGEIAEEKTAVTIERFKDIFVYVQPITINAFPLNLSAYYFYPLRKELKFFLKGGLGLMWAKYVERKGIKELPTNKFTFLTVQRATAQGKSFFSGIGLIYEANSYVRFFIEGEAKLAKISSFQGKTKEGEDGTLYFFEEYHPDLEFWEGKNMLLKEEPSGDNFRSIKKTTVNLSGLSLKIGFSFKF